MDMRRAACKGHKFEHDPRSRPVDIGQAAVAFRGGKVEGGRLIDEAPADQALAIVDDPAALLSGPTVKREEEEAVFMSQPQSQPKMT